MSQQLTYTSRERLIQALADGATPVRQVAVAVGDFLDFMFPEIDTHGQFRMPQEVAETLEWFVCRRIEPRSVQEADGWMHAMSSALSAVFDRMGTCESDVTDSLELDRMFDFTPSDVFDRVRVRITDDVQCSYVTVSIDGVIVDGMTMHYPDAVAEAVSNAVNRCRMATSRSPF